MAATDWRDYAPVLADDRRLVREGFDWLTAGERELLLGENARNPVRLRLRAQPRLAVPAVPRFGCGAVDGAVHSVIRSLSRYNGAAHRARHA